MLTPLPLVHMNAMAYSAMAMVLTGGCLIPLDRFHPRSWWDSVRDSRATGALPGRDARHPDEGRAPRDAQPGIRFGFGAGVDRKLHSPFEARFGFPLLEAWAMTETGAGAVIIASKEPRHIGSSCFGAEETRRYASSPTRASRPPRANPASCWCATPATIRATVSSPAT